MRSNQLCALAKHDGLHVHCKLTASRFTIEISDWTLKRCAETRVAPPGGSLSNVRDPGSGGTSCHGRPVTLTAYVTVRHVVISARTIKGQGRHAVNCIQPPDFTQADRSLEFAASAPQTFEYRHHGFRYSRAIRLGRVLPCGRECVVYFLLFSSVFWFDVRTCLLFREQNPANCARCFASAHFMTCMVFVLLYLCRFGQSGKQFR